MPVVVVGLNHKSVPLEVLESTAVPGEALGKALDDLLSRVHLDEVMVLSTCMRTEVYASTTRFHGALGDIRDFLCMWSGRPPEDLAGGLYDFHDRAAAAHLLRVAGGLDSVVLGEGEILRQVRAAAEGTRRHRAAGPVLGALTRAALEAGKRVRAETAIARGTTSLTHTAVMLAGRRLAETGDPGGDPCPGAAAFAGRRVLVVGAGEMGAGVAELLAEGPGIGAVLVANRTARRAERLAQRLPVEVVAWRDLAAAAAGADAVICATEAPRPILGPDQVQGPAVIVDLGVPRNVDPAVGALPGVTLYDLEDVKGHAGVAMAGRRGEVPKAEAILADELERWAGTAIERAVAAPVVAALRQRAEAIRQGELAAAAGRLADLEPGERRAVEAVTKRIVAKLLHDPTVAVKAAAADPRGERLAATLAELWGLEP